MLPDSLFKMIYPESMLPKSLFKMIHPESMLPDSWFKEIPRREAFEKKTQRISRWTGLIHGPNDHDTYRARITGGVGVEGGRLDDDTSGGGGGVNERHRTPASANDADVRDV